MYRGSCNYEPCFSNEQRKAVVLFKQLHNVCVEDVFRSFLFQVPFSTWGLSSCSSSLYSSRSSSTDGGKYEWHVSSAETQRHSERSALRWSHSHSPFSILSMDCGFNAHFYSICLRPAKSRKWSETFSYASLLILKSARWRSQRPKHQFQQLVTD